ncbi:uncharacterized protein LOC117649646 isoform X2 [Thrips palmi]|uniref:Uncharacterized protein LOC117649646 isoform X2 n=1 Tax=Thrips palmi TaxID=161013 RepID=A0A6P8ZT80_THRPL|nr:uncharacterized protein LOC117649646 isoform X2 [Thrips palmi]
MKENRRAIGRDSPSKRTGMMECYVCLDQFDIYSADRRPKVLPCGHSFCLRCLQGLQIRRCPLDNKVFAEEPQTLPDNFLVIQSCNTAAETAASRLWCRTCRKHASDDCVDEHSVCTVKKARGEEARPLLEALESGEAALDKLDVMVQASSVAQLEMRAALRHDKSVLAALRGSLRDAEKADEDVWEKARQAAMRVGLWEHGTRIVADPATRCTLTVNSGDKVVWRGPLDGNSGLVKMLLCQLAHHGDLQQPRQQQPEPLGQQQPVQQPEAMIQQQEVPSQHPTMQQEQPRHQQLQQQLVPVQQARQRPDAARWRERANEGHRVLSDQEMAAKMEVGARVARGRHWPQGCTSDGTPPSAGTVSSNYGNSDVAVKWDHCIASAATWFRRSQLRLVAPAPLTPQIGAADGKHYLDINSISPKTDAAMSKLLTGRNLAQVRVLAGLPCQQFITWSLKVLEQVAPLLEGLQLVAPELRHLGVVQAMPNLRALSITDTTREALQMASQMAGLRSLELHCQASAPLSVATPVPASAAGLQWLRLGVYPLAAALALLRAHAGTLEELQLVAASADPYGCPDLAGELRGCGLRRLKKVVLLRETAYGAFCRHDTQTCVMQTVQLSNVFLEGGVDVAILCSECNAGAGS